MLSSLVVHACGLELHLQAGADRVIELSLSAQRHRHTNKAGNTRCPRLKVFCVNYSPAADACSDRLRVEAANAINVRSDTSGPRHGMIVSRVG